MASYMSKACAFIRPNNSKRPVSFRNIPFTISAKMLLAVRVMPV